MALSYHKPIANGGVVQTRVTLLAKHHKAKTFSFMGSSLLTTGKSVTLRLGKPCPILGGFIHLGAYLLITTASDALAFSVVITLMALLIFGYIKGRFTGTRPFRCAIPTLFTGGVAAGAAFVIARAVS